MRCVKRGVLNMTKSFKSNKKGQAALEFLTTYGWAFLVILVAIGGLSYFGVFDIGRILPDGCKLDNTLQCGSVFAIQSTGDNQFKVDLEVKNGRDQQIYIDSISLIEKGLSEGTVTPTPCVLTPAPDSFTIDPGKFKAIGFDETTADSVAECGIDTNKGQKKTFVIDIQYRVISSSIQLQSNGELTTTVQ